ncbi:MAG: hypothetical protein ACPIOQ_80110, partial [Promethearchaeia archaeon]
MSWGVKYDLALRWRFWASSLCFHGFESPLAVFDSMFVEVQTCNSRTFHFCYRYTRQCAARISYKFEQTLVASVYSCGAWLG